MAQDDRRIGENGIRPSDSVISIFQLPSNRQHRVSFIEFPGAEARRTRRLDTPERYPLGCFRVSPMALAGAHAVLTTYDNRVLFEQNRGIIINDSFTAVPLPLKEGVLELKSAVSLCSACSYNFYHWMLDSLPKVIVAEHCGFSGTYLIPAANVSPALRPAMELLGIPPERAVHMEYGLASVEDLWIPTHFVGEFMEDIPEVHSCYRSAIMESAKGTPVPPAQRIFVNRPKGKVARGIGNQEEVLALVAAYGFDAIDMAAFDLKQQVALAMQASALVGPHGAGMTHIVWMPKGAVVVEIFPSNHEVRWFEPHTRLLQHDYAFLRSESNPDGTMLIDCAALGELLGRRFSRSRK